MAFKVMVSADVYDVKENIAFDFPSRPTMMELASACEAVYDIETRSKRRRDTPDVAFKVQQFQYFDEALCEWTELYNQLQLANCCQVFAFQPTSALHSDREGAVPAPRRYTTWLPVATTKIDRRVVPAATPQRRLEWVFQKLCGDHPSPPGVRFWSLNNIFQQAGMVFTVHPVTDYFDEYDKDKDGKLNEQEFRLFHEANPGVVDALYFRLHDVAGELPTVLEALDDAIEQERMAIRSYQRKEKEERAKKQKAAIQRLAEGKSSLVTSTEVRRREAWISQLADEKRKEDDENQRVLRKIEEEKLIKPAVAQSASPQPPLSSLPGMPRPAQPKSPTLKKGVSRPSLQSSASTPRRPTSISSTASRHTPQALDSLKKGYSFAPPGTTPQSTQRGTQSPVRSR